MNDHSVQDEWAVVDGQRTRLRLTASGPAQTSPESPTLPLLLLHGLGCSSDAWLPTLRVLSERGLAYPAYAPDLPGCGCTRCAVGALSMDELADWSARLLDALNLPRVYVAGNSMGCQVALAMARRHPERVGALVLLGPTTGRSQVPFWRYAAGLLVDGFGESATYNLMLTKMYFQMGLPRYLGTVRHMMADDPLAQAGAIRVPCLVARGGHDAIVSQQSARDLAAALPRGTYQALDSTAHAAEFNTPELFVAATLEFLQRVEAVRSPEMERSRDRDPIRNRQ